MTEWYGSRKSAGHKRYMKLKEINLQFSSKEEKVYHNDYEVNHDFSGHMTVELTDHNQFPFTPFGVNRYLSNKEDVRVSLDAIPKELREELKAVWLKVEEHLVKEDKD